MSRNLPCRVDVLDQRALERPQRRVEGLERAERRDVDRRDGVPVEPAPQVEGQGFHLGQLGHGQSSRLPGPVTDFATRSIMAAMADAAAPGRVDLPRRAGRRPRAPALLAHRGRPGGAVDVARERLRRLVPARGRRGARPDRVPSRRPRRPTDARAARAARVTYRSSRPLSQRADRLAAATRAKSTESARQPIRSERGPDPEPVRARRRPAPARAGRPRRAAARVRRRPRAGGASSRPERSLVLTGLRGVGKTVLLNALRSQAVRKGWGTGKLEARPDQRLRKPLASALHQAVRELAHPDEEADHVLGVLRAFAERRRGRRQAARPLEPRHRRTRGPRPRRLRRHRDRPGRAAHRPRRAGRRHRQGRGGLRRRDAGPRPRRRLRAVRRLPRDRPVGAAR